MNIQIYQTLKLDECWICGSMDSLEEHHIVPRAYGGQNSPMVTLCSACHANVHKAAQRKIEVDPYTFCTQWKTNLAAQKATYLFRIIKKAKIITQNDSNKTIKLSTTLDGSTALKLKYLTQQLGRPQYEVIKMAILELHRNTFGT